MSKNNKNYHVIVVGTHRHVVCDSPERTNSIFAQANYNKTGMALCGVLYPGETFEQWREKHS